MANETSHDFVVVGGGTAGAALAARLSENPECQVVLLEAGPDFPEDGEVPELLRDSNVAVTAGFNWNLQALRRQDGVGERMASLGRAAKVFEAASSRLALLQTAPRMFLGGNETLTRMNYPMARVMGGGSAVNGALAMHASAHDYDAWARAGNPLWSWDHVRPLLAGLEQEDAGRRALPIEAATPGQLTPLQAAFQQACCTSGYPALDLRGPLHPGAGALPKNTWNGVRASSAALYLARARGRANLRIIPDCHVDRVELVNTAQGVRADGVHALVDGGMKLLRARHVVLCAGAIHSPVILMRSGVGAPEALARHGIAPLLALGGVGRNLMDHTAVSLWGVAAPGSFQPGEPIHQMMLAHRSARAEVCDLQLFMMSAVPTARFASLDSFVGDAWAMGISVVLSAPRSRGWVELDGRDPLRSPRVQLNCLSDADEMERMMEGVRLAWRLLQSAPLRSRTARLALWNQGMIDSDTALRDAIHTFAGGTWHACGTLRMGPAHDALAVVDQRGRLHGCGNLTVADASVIPVIPGVPPNLTCLLVAERIAGWLGTDRE